MLCWEGQILLGKRYRGGNWYERARKGGGGRGSGTKTIRTENKRKSFAGQKQGSYEEKHGTYQITISNETMMALSDAIARAAMTGDGDKEARALQVFSVITAPNTIHVTCVYFR